MTRTIEDVIASLPPQRREAIEKQTIERAAEVRDLLSIEGGPDHALSAADPTAAIERRGVRRKDPKPSRGLVRRPARSSG